MRRPTNFRILEVAHPLPKREQLRNRNSEVYELISEIRRAKEFIRDAEQMLAEAREEAKSKPLVSTRKSYEKVFPGDPRYAKAKQPSPLSYYPYLSSSAGSSWDGLIKNSP